MANIKLARWKKTKLVLVSDETKTLTIAYWPKVELVLIEPTGVTPPPTAQPHLLGSTGVGG